MRIGRRERAHEAQKAVEEASRHLDEVKSRNTEVTEVAEALRSIRQRNHFAEQLAIIMSKGV